MNNAVMYSEAGARRFRPLIVWATIISLGAAGIALKTPFGHFLLQVMGQPVPNSDRTLTQWLFASEWGWLLMAAIGSALFYRRSGLNATASLERLMFRDMRSSDKPQLWRPALLAGLACTIFFAIALLSGLQAPLFDEILLGRMSQSDQMKLIALYPLADAGAALSEEVIYRYGALSTLMALMSFVRLGGQKPNNNVAFWLANLLQAAWFGFIHVRQGIVTSQLGGMALQTAIAPPTWSGIVLGYVYRRWGIVAAIVAHMAADIFIPVFWTIWGQLTSAG